MSGRGKEADMLVDLIAKECIAVRLRILTRGVTKLYNKALRPHGLTVSQMNILVVISRSEGAKPQRVCQVLHLHKSTLSRDIERMCARGWLENLPGENMRTGLLRVTQTGRRLLKKVFPAWAEAQQQAKALLGKGDIASLDRAVKALRSTKSS